MFRRRHEASDTVTVFVEGTAIEVPAGETAAAAALAAGLGHLRDTAVSGAPRAPWCMMGVCFDCLMEIDGVPNQQACMIRVRDGMTIARQRGAREVPPREVPK